MHEVNYYENKELWQANIFAETSQQERFRTCASLISEQVVSILDVGCGNGEFLKLLERNYPSGMLQGLERSVAAIESAVCNSEITLGTVDKVPFPDASFDLVSALEVIEHLPYGVYEKALAELSRVARKYILISVPFQESRAYTQCPYCACKFNSNYHMRSFDLNTMNTLFPDFQLAQTKKVRIEEYILGPLLRKIYRNTLARKSFPRHALCPQCGFRGNTAYTGTSSAKKQSWLRATLKNRLPKYRRTNWIVALYIRQSH